MELIGEMKKYRLDMGVSKEKRTGNGETLRHVYSGVQQGRAKVGSYVVKELAVCNKERKCISERWY